MLRSCIQKRTFGRLHLIRNANNDSFLACSSFSMALKTKFPQLRTFVSRPPPVFNPPNPLSEYEPLIEKPSWKRRLIVGFVKGFAVLFIGSALVVVVTCSERAPFTDRWRVVLPVDQVIPKFEDVVRHILNMQFENRVLSSYSLATLVVKRTAQRLIIANELNEHRDWKFMVIRDKMPNAFVTPGGTVCVLTGLLDVVETEEELAAVLAHEMAHSVAKHAFENASWNLCKLAACVVVTALTGPTGLFKAMLLWNISPDFVRFDLHHARNLEREADYIGLHLMANACLPLEAAPRVFQLLADFARRKHLPEPVLHRTHPRLAERITQLNAWIPEVRDQYIDVCRNHRGHK